MRIGVDFDNTIVCYDALFHRVALERGLIPPDLPVNKSDVRNHLRRIGQEPVWTAMQGEVYGARMSEAAPYPGALDFFRFCRLAQIPVSIISHKTRHPFLGDKHDLHEAARRWLEQQGFFDETDIGLPRDEVFFELTKEAKLARIAERECTEFIDDLPELLAEPGFPDIGRVLFDPNNLYAEETRFFRVRNWAEILENHRMWWEARKYAEENSRISGKFKVFVQENGFSGNIMSMGTLRGGGGGNNRVWGIIVENRRGVVKQYFQHPNDPRDRFAAERAFYDFLWKRGVRRTPEPLAWDAENRFGLFSHVEGRKLGAEELTWEHLDQAFAFIAELNRDRSGAESVPVASEACFSLAEHLGLVERRIARLEAVQPASDLDRQALEFVNGRLRPAWVKVREAIARARPGPDDPLPPEKRILSPSDFGFHNALLAEDGRLRFFDFEYAGWDDPAKLLCDFFCQPQIPVPLEFWDRAAAALARAGFAVDARPLLPAYQIKWVCIMLNDFTRGDRERRRFAQGPDADARKAAQLAKAAKSLAEISSG